MGLWLVGRVDVAGFTFAHEIKRLRRRHGRYNGDPRSARSCWYRAVCLVDSSFFRNRRALGPTFKPVRSFGSITADWHAVDAARSRKGCTLGQYRVTLTYLARLDLLVKHFHSGGRGGGFEYGFAQTVGQIENVRRYALTLPGLSFPWRRLCSTSTRSRRHHYRFGAARGAI